MNRTNKTKQALHKNPKPFIFGNLFRVFVLSWQSLRPQGDAATKTPKHKKDIKNRIRLDKYFRALVLLWRSLCSQSNSIFRAFVFSWLLYCSQSIKAFRVLVLSWLSFRYWAPLNKKLNLTTK
jgi:hypothetical protein